MARKKLTSGLIIAIAICIFIVLVSFGTVFLNFKDHQISDNLLDWGAFSDYLNPFVSLANLILIGYITIFISRTNLIIEKPTLIFELNKSMQRYIVRNIGKGPALNVILKHKIKKENKKWDSSVLCYSLGQSDSLEITWEKGGDEWIAYYDDIFDNHYCSDIKNDYITFRKVKEKEYLEVKQEITNTVWSVKKKIDK